MRIHLSVLCYLLLLRSQNAEAFSIPTRSIRRNRIENVSQPETCTRQNLANLYSTLSSKYLTIGTLQWNPPSCGLLALKKNTKEEATTLTTSEKIHEMAAFLAVQLLEVTMKEITNEEGESNVELDDMQRLVEVLQGPLTELKQVQDNGTGNAAEELLGIEATTKLDPPTIPTGEMKQNDEEESKESVWESNEESTPKSLAPKSATTELNETDESLLSLLNKLENKESIVGATDSTTTTTPPMSPIELRIPAVISTAFGRPLEVIASNIDPLRQMPKRNSHQKRDPEPSVVSATSQEKKQPQPKIDDKTVFQKSSNPSISRDATECNNTDNEESSINKTTHLPTTESAKGESVDLIRDLLSQPPSKPSPLSISKISESRLKSIIEARRQPKPLDEETNVAGNYSKLSLEDRAFAILFDLGMIEENKDPQDPSYDHTDDDEFCEHMNFPYC